MSSTEDLQRAIETARAGRKAEARELFIRIVEADPQNEAAWMWLAGLVDSLEDRIIACENVLTINPSNEKVRGYLTRLQQQQKAAEAERLLAEAKVRADRTETDAALQLARQVLELQPRSEQAWLLVAGLSSDIDQQIEALANASQLNPDSPGTASALKQARYLKANPIIAATRLEQMGKFEKALQVYQQLAAKARTSKEFDHIYKQILRIEALQKENIRYVPPEISIRRLTVSWPLLYVSLALVQVGLNPFTRSGAYLWLGLPFVVLGSFLLSLAEIPSKHPIWQKLFDEPGDGSTFARLATAATGWFLIILPHVLLVFDSLNRLRTFRIPPIPF